MFTLNVFYPDDKTMLPMRAQFTYNNLPEAFASASEYAKVGKSIVELLQNGNRVFYFDPTAPKPVFLKHPTQKEYRNDRSRTD